MAHDSGLRVPLIVRWPTGRPRPDGYEPATVDGQLVASIDVTATTLWMAGVERPGGMQGQVFMGNASASPRQYVFGGRDRGDETVDRIRTVRDARFRYIRNYYPDRPLLQLNRYKEFTYPMIPLMRELQAEGRLTPVQARLLAPSRPEVELYDLEADPYEIDNLADDPAYAAKRAELTEALEAWIVESNDQGRTPESEDVHESW